MQRDPTNGLLSVPGFAEAVVRQRFVRDASFLGGVTDSIGQFEVTAMNLRQWLILEIADNPLMRKREPTSVQLAQFLWVLNPHFSTSRQSRERFMVSCRVFTLPRRPMFFVTRRAKLRLIRAWRLRRSLVRKAQRYVKETFQDKPGGGRHRNGCFVADYFSYAASLCDVFWRERGWDEERVMREPLTKLFQYLNVFSQRNGSKIPMFNPCDEVAAAYFLRQSERIQLPPPIDFSI